MKIVIVDTDLGLSWIGGAQLFLPKLAGGLIECGHAVDVVTSGEPNSKVRDAIAATGASVYSDIWPAGPVEDSVRYLKAWIDERRPDVFAISVSRDIGWAVLPYLDASVATVAIGHNDQETFYQPAEHYASFLTRAVGVSREICRKYTDRAGVVADRVVEIPYGVETSAEAPKEFGGPIRLIYVGRVEEAQKRFRDVIRISKTLPQSGVPYVLNVIGDGESMSAARQELADEIETGQVKLRSWLQGEKVLDVMRSSEIFILTSAYEGFCIALVEAMANGCAPVVTDIPSGNGQLVEDGFNGFLLPIGNSAAFVDKIKSLASDRAKLAEFRRRSWETGRQYSIPRMVERYEECFTDAVADARRSPRQQRSDFPSMPSCRSRYPLWIRRLKAKAGF
jgi:glycosyltransferase involved in cell wall biosynthesis